MEYALRHYDDFQDVDFVAVLILVLMEYALRPAA